MQLNDAIDAATIAAPLLLLIPVPAEQVPADAAAPTAAHKNYSYFVILFVVACSSVSLHDADASVAIREQLLHRQRQQQGGGDRRSSSRGSSRCMYMGDTVIDVKEAASETTTTTTT